jgi:hypothetical protein
MAAKRRKSRKKVESYFEIFFAPFSGQMPFSYRIKLDQTVLDRDSVFAGFGESGDEVREAKLRAEATMPMGLPHEHHPQAFCSAAMWLQFRMTRGSSRKSDRIRPIDRHSISQAARQR